MLEVVAQLEEAVRRYPWQWFQFQDFWPQPVCSGASGEDTGAPRASQQSAE